MNVFKYAINTSDHEAKIMLEQLMNKEFVIMYNEDVMVYFKVF